MRRYIVDNDKYYELDKDSIIKYPRDVENVYFWKWFTINGKNECKLVYKEFVMKDLIILDEEKVPEELKPKYFDFEEESNLLDDIIRKIKDKLNEVFRFFK